MGDSSCKGSRPIGPSGKYSAVVDKYRLLRQMRTRVCPLFAALLAKLSKPRESRVGTVGTYGVCRVIYAQHMQAAMGNAIHPCD